MASKSVTCPHCSKMFTIEGTGVTAEIRSFTRAYMAKNPKATRDMVAKAYLAEHKDVNLSTLNTQVGQAF